MYIKLSIINIVSMKIQLPFSSVFIRRITLCAFLLASALSSFSQDQKPIKFTLLLNKTVQQIHNIGGSGCWYTEEIGKQWPLSEKQHIAELLFSREIGKDGRPKGIGLSAWRFNIGGGTAEQGDSSGIADPSRRVECFLSPDGTYDWSKQQGYTWMLQQAKNYGVKDLIAFVNSPPVQFNKNGRGYKSRKDGSTNLKPDKYDAYANFLTQVIRHYDKKGLHFNYISPINEPQWDWLKESNQEGSPWTNEEMFQTIKSLNVSLAKQKLSTKILTTEAGQLDYLYVEKGRTSRQIDSFWNPKSPLYIGNFSNSTKFVEGHGYFTENGDSTLINTRRSLRDTLKKYNGLEYWQSEYSMLGNGYKDKIAGKPSEMDHALFLAKVINHDFTVGDASAWHFWNAYEPGNPLNPRYFLIALNPQRASKPENKYTITKNLWALGHYSLFIRPGMVRIETQRNDGLNDLEVAQQVMVSAFKDPKGKNLVINVINYTGETKKTDFVLKGLLKGQALKLKKHYVTSEKKDDNIRPYPTGDTSLPPRSISTFVFSAL